MSRDVPLSAVPAQTLSVVLEQQNCQISVFQKTTGLYFHLALDGAPIVDTVVCRWGARLLLGKAYTGFRGDFGFVDLQGQQDPEYTGLGSRYVLVYFAPDELEAGP